ncbi:hypothetical protein BDP27DRAFT_1369857 [Rhodocollybia butyracea]|uniref:Uncharacterized protein n=1 Tax=Rhodocollybia butyracea TaxID=206335 RepID=A0A9P5U0A6_9AGAR|nr:hypothetical protein BDP27DRAFT_1369857 [Rhodocollybia butyracea]
MAYDTTSGQLAVVQWAEAIHRFVVDIGMIPRILKLVTIAKHWPQAVTPRQVGVRGPKLWSFRREDGVIYILSDKGKILKSKMTGMIIGHAVVNTKEDAVILNDFLEGVALMKLAGTERVKTFETVELNGVPLIIVGRLGENIGKTKIQIWEKVVAAPVSRNTARREEGRWLLLIALSCILVFENILCGFGDAHFRKFQY